MDTKSPQYIVEKEIADAVVKEASKLNPVPVEMTSFSNAIEHINITFTETWVQQRASQKCIPKQN